MEVCTGWGIYDFLGLFEARVNRNKREEKINRKREKKQQARCEVTDGVVRSIGESPVRSDLL